MLRRIITIIVAALAAIALCALAAPHAHAATVGDMPPATDGTETTDDGWVDTPQTGRGPSMDEQPAPGGRTHLRDVLRPCVTEADTYDGCYDASRDSGLWRSEGGEYRTWDDGTWSWVPAGTAPDAPEGAADGQEDADSPEGAADASGPAYDAQDAPDAAVEESTGDGDVLPSVAADSPEVLADADDQHAAAAPSADDADDAAPTDDGQYAADGTRVALAHTGPSTTMAATLAAGAAAAILAGAALMALARAGR